MGDQERLILRREADVWKLHPSTRSSRDPLWARAQLTVGGQCPDPDLSVADQTTPSKCPRKEALALPGPGAGLREALRVETDGSETQEGPASRKEPS